MFTVLLNPPALWPQFFAADAATFRCNGFPEKVLTVRKCLTAGKGTPRRI